MKARELLIQRVKESMESCENIETQKKTPSQSSGEQESWEMATKRRRWNGKKRYHTLHLFSLFIWVFILYPYLTLDPQLREAVGRQQETSVESLIDSYIYSEIQDIECLR